MCRAIGDAYLNWDNTDDRRAILKGPRALAAALEVDRLRAAPPIAVFDELHKDSKWKTLLKAVEGWTDLGFGDFGLRYISDKARREVDFLVVRDRKPWFLVEAKLSDAALSPALGHFQAQTRAPHAFQVVIGLPFEPVDCFAARRPAVVPARTFLGQLL